MIQRHDHGQLAFAFPRREQYDAADFITTPANEAAQAWLARPLDWPGRRLALSGPPGAGKTHLLHLFAERQGAALLHGGQVRRLVEMPPSGGVAVDDADRAPEPQALLHLINAASEDGLPVLLAARAAPSHWGTTLPDLASRLRATATVELGLPDDGLLRALLARLLIQRQLRVAATVQDYLLARLPRQGAALREAVACLDHLSLAAGRSVGLAMAAEALVLMGTGDMEAPAPSSPDDLVLL